MPSVEVLVPTCDRPVELATTLAGLAAQDHPFDLVVFDQSTGPASYDTAPARAMIRVLELAGHRVRTGRHLPRRGVAEHRAALAGRSTARYVLFLDDDVWLAPGTVARLHEAIVELGCGLVGAALEGLSYVADERPAEQAAFERWDGPPQPEDLRPDTPEWERWRLHNAANPVHLARRHVRPDDRWVAYKIAWVAGCTLYDRAALEAVGGFDFWSEVPETVVGEDVVAQQRVLAEYGGAGILPSGAVHLESVTTIPDRSVTADGLLPPRRPRGTGRLGTPGAEPAGSAPPTSTPAR
ncbi:glycosyltransferase family 2 protein [Pseudonocardia oroxyli]|uniref:Glycosyl transferase family 2 n=1 Tax=Pseudonocardia oroxyli TaxID=366584 RepID=A0A1G7XRP2_PSEOR|nr:glycosyltransferase family A protein [Pseudonocardia oroxyli]SDG86791.1 Glycosyl transferase family 2 [Pseudonocardia oroxyli]